MKEFYPEGRLIYSIENRHNISSPAALVQSQIKEKVIEGNVIMCDSDHNLTVDLGCMKGIIPRYEGAIGIDDGTTRDIALISRVGKPVCAVVTAVKTDSTGGLFAVLSRKKAQEMCKRTFFEKIKIGDVIDAKVTHLESFGAFCDIGCGNIALLPIDAISVSRITHPKDRFKIGENIKVIVKSIADDGKITLSHKELLGTWEDNIKLFSPGQTVSGIVRSVEEYGVFVELTPNLAGLAELKEGIEVGDQASVYIKSILPDRMKVKLIIIDNFQSDYRNETTYFYSENHIDEWHYSPENCSKKILTYF